MGLYRLEGKFILRTVNDARGPYPVVAAFGSEEVFVDWLAQQSDQSMFAEPTNERTKLDRASAKADVKAKLMELKELFDMELISEAAYNEKEKELLCAF